MIMTIFTNENIAKLTGILNNIASMYSPIYANVDRVVYVKNTTIVDCWRYSEFDVTVGGEIVTVRYYPCWETSDGRDIYYYFIQSRNFVIGLNWWNHSYPEKAKIRTRILIRTTKEQAEETFLRLLLCS